MRILTVLFILLLISAPAVAPEPTKCFDGKRWYKYGQKSPLNSHCVCGKGGYWKCKADVSRVRKGGAW